MKYSELKKLNCIYDGIEYTPIYEVDEYIPLKDDNRVIIDIELKGFKLLKTAEQNYKDSNNVNVLPQQPTEVEQLQKQLLETQNMLLELQEQILLNKQIK